ncbi:hypothetical protein NADE_002611 [Nannochloris sp. 'desiccata']|nr:hypothetical protein KSW81_005671 [Chlorella desiccata (nom. nud.)]KAH7623422.1 hypothetical protein NADE_002611 [Chlorella desiccata (nom. nud.)]
MNLPILHQRHFLGPQPRHHSAASAPRRRTRSNRQIVALQNTSKQPENDSSNAFVRVVVAAATETLRLLGVGGSTPPPSATATPPGCSDRPAAGDIAAVLQCLKSDYEERSYFITGVLSDGIYDEDCYFADPTVSFTGRELWKRNLQLLVPFLIEPSIQLTGLKQLNSDPENSTSDSSNISNSSGGGGPSTGQELIETEEDDGKRLVKLRAEWILKCTLRLPWRPYINVVGSTDYDLAYPDSNRIVRHVESWDISAWEALVLVFTPGKK